MTALCGLKYGDEVILVSDVLLTVDADPRADDVPGHVWARIPSMPNVNVVLPPGAAEHRITGAIEKILQIGSWMIVGWTGDRAPASRIVGRLANSFQSEAPSFDKLCKLLNTEVSTTGASCDLGGWLRINGGWTGFTWNRSKQDSLETTDTITMGTGTEQLEAYLGMPQLSSSDGPPLQRAISLATLIALEESVSGATLAARYGLGAQIFYSENGTIQRLRSLTLALGLSETDDKCTFAKQLIKYEQINNRLVILGIKTKPSCRLFENGVALDPDLSASTLIIPIEPLIDRTPDEPAVPFPASLVSDFYGLGIRAVSAPGELMGANNTSCCPAYDGSNNPPIRTEKNHEGADCLTFNRAWLDESIAFTRSLYRTFQRVGEDEGTINLVKGFLVQTTVFVDSNKSEVDVLSVARNRSGPKFLLFRADNLLWLKVEDKIGRVASVSVGIEKYENAGLAILAELKPLKNDEFELSIRLNDSDTPNASTRARLDLDAMIVHLPNLDAPPERTDASGESDAANRS